jgi:hypothetical protein
MRRAAIVLAWALLPAACDDRVVVQFQTGPRQFELSAAMLGVPSVLREDASGGARIARIPCGGGAMCPTAGGIVVTCEDGVCDPAPRTLSVALGEVIDFDVLASDARSLVRRIDSIEVVAASYTILVNTLTIAVPTTEVFWGPESAVDVDPSMGVVRLGVVPELPAGSMASGSVDLDPAGVAALSDHLVWSSSRVRFFARTRIDLAPGDPFPEGTLRVAVDFRVRIAGSTVR